jgi:hypothetical protein
MTTIDGLTSFGLANILRYKVVRINAFRSEIDFE